MTSARVDVATRGFEAFNRRDLETVLGLLADDVVTIVSPSLANAGTYRGHDGFTEMISAWDEAWEEFQVEPKDVIEEAGLVIVAARQSGRGRGSGIDVEMDTAFMFRVEDGLIGAMWVCDGVEEALAFARGGGS